MPPLGISDHNMCHLIPIYKQKLKLHTFEKQVYSWNSDVNETLLGCMECTDFDVLYDDDETIDHNVAVLNGYIQFCIDLVVPRKRVKCYPNNKPWVTKGLKDLLNEKKRLLSTDDRAQLKVVQKQVNKEISLCKQKYKEKVESLFKSDTKSITHATSFKVLFLYNILVSINP